MSHAISSLFIGYLWLAIPSLVVVCAWLISEQLIYAPKKESSAQNFFLQNKPTTD